MRLHFRPRIMITPHDYQIDFVNKIAAKIGQGYKSIICQLATGGGKTVCMAYLVLRYIKKNNSAKIGIIVHREELVNQTERTLNAFGVNNVKVLMVETFNNYIKKHGLPNYDVLIIDEAHYGSHKKIIDHYKETKTLIIGFSATPISATKKHPLKADYQTIVCGLEIQSLIDKGNLTPAIYYSPNTELDKSQLKKTAGEYNTASMSVEFSKPKLVEAVVYNYEKLCKGKKTIVFNTTIEHSILVHNSFKNSGYNSRFLDSKTFSKEERKEVLEWFKITPDAILNNVGILTAGFDEPSIEAVIFNRSTKSLSLWLQCLGRGARKYEGKDFWLAIDLGDNIQGEGHGYWHQKHDWEMYFLHPDKPGEGAAPMKNCPECEAMIYMASTKCYVCNHEMPRKTVYTDLILELKIMPENIKRNSQPALESAIENTISKIKRLNLDPHQKLEMIEIAIPKIYDEAGWELRKYTLKHLIQKYA